MTRNQGQNNAFNAAAGRWYRATVLASVLTIVSTTWAGETTIPAANTAALRGVGNPVPTISLGGASGIRTFMRATGSSLLNPIPGNSITLGPAGSEITYTIPANATIYTGASLQFAPNNFNTLDATTGYLQSHSALRLEFHEQGSLGGLLALADSQIDDSLMDNTLYNATGANATYVNHNVFGGQHVLGFPPADQWGTPVPGTANGFYLGINTSDTEWNPDAQDPIQVSITEGALAQAFARGDPAQAAWYLTPNDSGYGQGNPALPANPPGVPNARQQLYDESILNMSTDKIDPDTGQNFTPGPWNTAGAANLNSTMFAASALTLAANPGTGLTRLNRTDAQWLQATGRLANGADFNVATQDISSGVRNAAALMTGIDPSFAVGENDDGNGYAPDGGTTQAIVGPGMRFSNHTSEGSQQKLVIARSRMAVGALDLTDCANNARVNIPPPNGGRQPIRILDYRDDADDLQNGSNAPDHKNWNENGYSEGDLPDGTFIRVTAANITNGSYPLYTQYSFVSLKRPNTSEYDLPLIKGDNSGNDAKDFWDNVVLSANGYGTDGRVSEASPAKSLLDNAYILPQLMKVTKSMDGINTSQVNPSLNATVRDAFLFSSYADYFCPADPSTLTTGIQPQTIYGLGIGSVNLDANGQPVSYNAPVGGDIRILTYNWFFGDFKRNNTASLLVRDLNDLFSAQRAQDLLQRSGLALDWNEQPGSNNKTLDQGDPSLASDPDFLAMQADLAFNPTKGDLIVLGDFNTDGRFDGKDLWKMAHGSALADNASSTTLSGGSTAFPDKVRSLNVVLRKNYALDWLQDNGTDAQKTEAQVTFATAPVLTPEQIAGGLSVVGTEGVYSLGHTGSVNGVPNDAMNNAFNKLDVNRDGVVTRLDVKAVYDALGKNYTDLTDALSVVITDETGSIKLLDLVNAKLIDPVTPTDTIITWDDFLTIANAVSAAGGLLPFGDFDFDGDVDADDLVEFQNCVTAPGISQTSERCLTVDVDGDSDIDQDDFSAFQRCYSGDGIIVAPNCAN